MFKLIRYFLDFILGSWAYLFLLFAFINTMVIVFDQVFEGKSGLSWSASVTLLFMSSLGFYARQKLKKWSWLTAAENEYQEARATAERVKKQTEKKQGEYLNSIRRQCNHEPVVTTVMGGSGWNVMKGEVLLLSCGSESLYLSNILTEQQIKILFSELLSAEVTGPGTESSNAGLIGGGFGVEGAVKGILVATVFNALTTRSKTNTFLRLSTSSAEVIIHIAALEPAELRLVLSPAFVKMEANRQIRATQSGQSDTMLSVEIEKLHRMFRDGILTEDEFILAKKGLLTIGEIA